MFFDYLWWSRCVWLQQHRARLHVRLLFAAHHCLPSLRMFLSIARSMACLHQVGGVSTREINRLETRFLNLLDYRLVVTPEEFHQYFLYVISLAGSKLFVLVVVMIFFFLVIDCDVR